MLDPIALMKNFQETAKLGELAAATGLAPAQARSAAEALLPALAATLRRRAADPRGLAEMMGLVKTKPDFAASMPGGEALGRLFGSREVTRAVIDQVAKTSGVDARVLDVVLPATAESMMGAFSDALKSHPLTQGLAPLIEPKPRSAPTLDEILTDTIGPNTSRLVGKTLAGTPNPLGPSNPFGEILGEFIRGFNNGGPPIDEPVAPEDEIPSPAVTVARLFEAGREAQDEHARAIDTVLDRFFKDAGDLAAAHSAATAAAARKGAETTAAAVQGAAAAVSRATTEPGEKS